MLEFGPICLDFGLIARIWAILAGFGQLGRVWVKDDILLGFGSLCLNLGHFAWIWALFLGFGPYSWIWAIWQNLGQNRPQRRQSPEDGVGGINRPTGK